MRFIVADTGPGIAPDQIAAIFDPFIQGDASATRRRDGAGLGLTICRRLCERMGGTIAVDSDLGRGTTFTVELPVRPPPAA